jgi:hypothetical protein
MNETGSQTQPHLASPEEAIARVATHEGPLYIDLDGTLYLRNSTEDFIDSARPSLPAALILSAFELLKPWRWTGGAPTRDAWRVWLVRTLFPWTRVLWRRRVATLAATSANRRLIEALRNRKSEVVIVTIGFRPIVEPLIAALGFAANKVVAARVGFEDRVKGKLHLATLALGGVGVSSSLFLTDSPEDLPLLAKCGRPLLTCWPEADYHRAFERVYIPGEYISRIKRPGERYIWGNVIQEDFAHWVLSSVALAAYPLQLTVSLGLLLASFWIVYERAYVDNDWAAVNLESDGKLSQRFWASRVATPAVQPWLWAAAIGAAAVYGLGPPAAVPVNFAKWLAVLIGTYCVFKLYNRVDKSSRTWLYVVLQFARATAFVALVAIVPVGAAALGSMALSRWVPYYLYRRGRGEWPQLDVSVIRLVFFVVLAALLGMSLGSRVVLNWTAAALLAWNVFRARRELIGLLRRVHFIRLADSRSPVRQHRVGPDEVPESVSEDPGS